VVCKAVVVVVNIVAFDAEVVTGTEVFFDEHPAIPRVQPEINPKVRKIAINLKCLLCNFLTP
jgi:hypothetical protein